jgi:hypothetical protein
VTHAENPRRTGDVYQRMNKAEFAAERARHSRRAIPELIELLESEDLRTRFVAEMCLRDATNT